MKRFLIIVTILSFACFQGMPQDANLTREHVTMKLDSAHFVVSGEYYFRNPLNHPVSQTVFFPYQFEKQTTKVDTLSIYDVSDNVTLKPKKKMSNGVFFLLNLDKNEEKQVRVNYSQDHDGQSATYILSSARYLPTPIILGTYNLTVSNKIEIDSFSMKPENTGNMQDWTIYKWHRANFKPSRDLIIYFHLKK